DEETGLHYNWWRYYDPEVGRYLRVDPIGLEGGINLFRFVENNPINNIDFNGLSCIKLFSFTVPSGISKDFRLKHLGDWEFIAPPQAQLSISPGKILGKYGPVISNTTTGLALCNAKRKRIYEGTYKLFGTRIEGGVCYDKCYRVTRWSREEQVILGEGHLRDRIEYDGASKAIKIVAPVAFLANLVCAQWLMTLR
ncbi:RHS repeat-associated protein, partial [Desulfobotulus alkaliphilus]